MATVTSKDGTRIAYEKQGEGSPLILVDGALCFRGFGPMPGLAKLLDPHFTVYTYDRRGRGESTNGKPYAVDREVEDINALVEAAGGSAFVYGISSGACLALEAALQLRDRIAKLALYEPPYNPDRSNAPRWREYRTQLADALAGGHRGEAAALFMRYVGTPPDQVEGMSHAPVWAMFEQVAPTLSNDAAAMGPDAFPPVDRAAKVITPTLVMDGGANLGMMPFMHQTATALASAIPNAQHRTLEGQTHDVNPQVLAPVLIEFFEA